jgi:hypothetical protein
VAAVRDLAAEEALPVVDVHGAFRRAGPLEELLVDDSSPSERGSVVWADAVRRQLG